MAVLEVVSVGKKRDLRNKVSELYLVSLDLYIRLVKEVGCERGVPCGALRPQTGWDLAPLRAFLTDSALLSVITGVRTMCSGYAQILRPCFSIRRGAWFVCTFVAPVENGCNFLLVILRYDIPVPPKQLPL